MNRATHRGIGGDRDAPDEIHGIARVSGAVAAGGDGQDRRAGTGGGGRGGRRTRDGQRHCFGPAGIRREDPRRPASLDLRRVRRELHRRRGARVRHARCRLLEGLVGRGLPGPGRRVLLRGPGTRGDRPRGRRPRLLANWLGSRGRGGRGGGLRPDRGPGDRGGRPCPGVDRAPGTPRRGPPVRQGPRRRRGRDRHRAGHGRSPRGRRLGGPSGHAVRRCGGGGDPSRVRRQAHRRRSEGHDPDRGVLRELAERAPSRLAVLRGSGRAIPGRVRRRDRAAVGSRGPRSRARARFVRRRQDDDRGVRRDALVGRGVRRWSEGRPNGGRDRPGVGERSRTILAALGNVNGSPGMSREDSRGESRFLVCLDRGPKYPGFHAEPRIELGPKLKELRTKRILTLGTVSFFVDPPLFVVFCALVVILQPPSDSAGLLVFIAAQRLAFLGVMMLLIVAGFLLVPVLITFYLTLRDVSRALLLTAVALGAGSIAFHFVGVAGSLSLVGLSDSYSAATSGMARAAYLASAAAPQQFNPTASIIHNLSSSVSSLLIGLIMLRSPIFSS